MRFNRYPSKEDMMNVVLNGKPLKISGDAPLTVRDLLKQMKLSEGDYFSTVVNGRAIEKERFDSAAVVEGDVVEVLKYMGGG